MRWGTWRLALACCAASVAIGGCGGGAPGSAPNPLAPASASELTLTSGKLDAWIQGMNACLASSTELGALACPQAKQDSLASPAYRHDARNLKRDIAHSACNGTQVCSPNITLKNPVVVFVGRYPGSSSDDMAIVEVAMEQPLGAGQAAGESVTRLFYFKRDDSTPGLAAGNWTLHGNQGAFDWGVNVAYAVSRDLAASTSKLNWATTSIEMNFSPKLPNPATGFPDIESHVYAVRLKGPGLPAGGLVFARDSTDDGAAPLGIVNKTGSIPSPASNVNLWGSRFALESFNTDTRSPISEWYSPSFPDGPDAPGTLDFGTLQAFAQYTAEIFLDTQADPLVESRLLPAQALSPAAVMGLPFNDFSPSEALLAQAQAASASVDVQWMRKVGGLQMSAITFSQTVGSQFESGRAVLPDARMQDPASTSVRVAREQGGNFTAFAALAGNSRTLTVTGSAGRASYSQSVSVNY